jgi:hypothetical protein
MKENDNARGGHGEGWTVERGNVQSRAPETQGTGSSNVLLAGAPRFGQPKGVRIGRFWSEMSKPRITHERACANS